MLICCIVCFALLIVFDVWWSCRKLVFGLIHLKIAIRRRQSVSCCSRSSVEQSSIARHCPPSLSIFCCRLKSHLFSLSYPAFWLFSHLYSALHVQWLVILDTNRYCLSNALHCSIGQNIKPLACPISGVRSPARVWKTSNGYNSATHHLIDFVFGSRLGFLARIALFNLTAHELHELYYDRPTS